MSFRLVTKSMTLNDLERHSGPYFALFHWIHVRCRRKTITSVSKSTFDSLYNTLSVIGVGSPVHSSSVSVPRRRSKASTVDRLIGRSRRHRTYTYRRDARLRKPGNLVFRQNGVENYFRFRLLLHFCIQHPRFDRKGHKYRWGMPANLRDIWGQILIHLKIMQMSYVHSGIKISMAFCRHTCLLPWRRKLVIFVES